MAETSEQMTHRLQVLEAENRDLKQEVHRLKAENRRWARLAGTDALTGLPNKISFMRALVPQTLQHATREQKSVGFILMAADNLGTINETYGRSAGDQVLKGMATLLQGILDEADRLGHIDGTHFAVVFFPADLNATRRQANMLRARIRSHGFACADTTAQMTVSAGIAAFEPSLNADGKTEIEHIFQVLNEALYMAKTAGGNQVQVVEDSQLKPSV